MLDGLFTYLVQGEGLGDRKAPPLLKGPADHRRAGGGGGAGQAERVRKADPSDLHADVHSVNGGIEEGKLGLTVYRYVVERLQANAYTGPITTTLSNPPANYTDI